MQRQIWKSTNKLQTKLFRGGEQNPLAQPSPLHKKHYAGEGFEDGNERQWYCPIPTHSQKTD